MTPDVQQRLDKVRNALAEAGTGLSPADWKELLEELDADVYGHLDAIREEAKEQDDG